MFHRDGTINHEITARFDQWRRIFFPEHTVVAVGWKPALSVGCIYLSLIFSGQNLLRMRVAKHGWTRSYLVRETRAGVTVAVAAAAAAAAAAECCARRRPHRLCDHVNRMPRTEWSVAHRLRYKTVLYRDQTGWGGEGGQAPPLPPPPPRSPPSRKLERCAFTTEPHQLDWRKYRVLGIQSIYGSETVTAQEKSEIPELSFGNTAGWVGFAE